MQAERNPQVLHASRGVHVLRPVRAEEGGIVQVAPEVDVVGEKVGPDAERLHSHELGLRHHLVVLEPVPVGELRILMLGGLDRGECHLGRLIAVGVDHRLKPALVHFEDALAEVLLRDVGDAVLERLVVVGPLQQPGVALQRAVDDELDAAEAQPVVIGLVQLDEIVESALLRDLALLEDLDDRVHHDPDRKVGIGRDRLIGLVAARKAAEGEIGERRHAGALRELAHVPGGLGEQRGVERRQLGDEGRGPPRSLRFRRSACRPS